MMFLFLGRLNFGSWHVAGSTAEVRSPGVRIGLGDDGTGGRSGILHSSWGGDTA